MTDTDSAETAAPNEDGQEEGAEKVKVNRREFISIAWLASLGFFLIPFGGVTILFAFPRFKEGEFGGTFTLRLADLPETDAGPNVNTRGKFWITRTEEGARAIYKVCTHLGCLYNWQDNENKFICPCHGSQFRLNSTYIQGPAPRSLDLFNMRAVAPDGSELAATPGPNQATTIFDDNPDVVYIVDTGDKIKGEQHD